MYMCVVCMCLCVCVQLIRVKDRKHVDYCLAPTHEEVITDLVASQVASFRQLPVRFYQIGMTKQTPSHLICSPHMQTKHKTGPKYRDEIRPRFGLLRAREFVMKDLYSFDATPEAAMRTYEVVRQAYVRIFHRLRLPAECVEADTGNIGGDLSHEFQVHFVSSSLSVFPT